ncbi:MAG: hypothetical protein ABI323_06175 [Solirubrobacteraceae bacterium]
MFTERVTVSDFESGHFQAQLVERLGWAVEDAHAVERDHREAAAFEATSIEPEPERTEREMVSDAQPVS